MRRERYHRAALPRILLDLRKREPETNGCRNSFLSPHDNLNRNSPLVTIINREGRPDREDVSLTGNLFFEEMRLYYYNVSQYQL